LAIEAWGSLGSGSFLLRNARKPSMQAWSSGPAAWPSPEAGATQWVKPGIIGRVRHLRGEEDRRHASLQDFPEKW